jgi:putative transposase
MPEHRRLPHLRPFAPQPIVFLTTVTHKRRAVLACQPALDALTAIWQRSAELDGWFVGDYLLMPDHVHFFARAAIDAKPLADWMETWKSLSSRQLKQPLGLASSLWQRDYFDRFLRSAESYSEKWDYVANNPVRAGLCARPEDWPWKGRLFDLQF